MSPLEDPVEWALKGLAEELRHLGGVVLEHAKRWRVWIMVSQRGAMLEEGGGGGGLVVVVVVGGSIADDFDGDGDGRVGWRSVGRWVIERAPSRESE